MANERELRAILRFGLDKRSQQQLIDGTLSVAEALEQVEAQAEKTEQQMRILREASDVGEQIAEGFLLAGAAITGPLLLGMRQYLQTADEADQVSNDWVAAMERLESAESRVGRIVAEAVLPTLEKAADIAGDLADFAESNPGIIKAALNIGGIFVALGTAGVAAARMGKFVADMGDLIALTQKFAVANLGTGAASAAAGGGGGAVTGAAVVGRSLPGLITVLGGLVAGLEGYNRLAESGILGEDRDTAGEIIGKTASIVAGGWGALFGAVIGDEELGFRWFEGVGKLTGVIERDTEAREAMLTGVAEGPSPMQLTEQQVNAYIAYREAEAEIEENYNDQRVDILEQYTNRLISEEERYEERRSEIVAQAGADRAALEADYARTEQRQQTKFDDQRLADAQSFARQQAQAEQAYYTERARAAQAYGIAAQRAEEDHQRALARLQEERDQNILDAATSRDATALYRAQQDYERNRQRAEDDFQLQAGRRSEDYALQAAQMEQAFAQQQAQRAADYARQQEDARAEFEAERVIRQEDYALRRDEIATDAEERLAQNEQFHEDELSQAEQQNSDSLTELDRQYNNERTKRSQAFNDQLADLGLALGAEQETRNAYYAAMEKDLRDWLGRMQTAFQTPVTAPTTAPIGGASVAGVSGFGGSQIAVPLTVNQGGMSTREVARVAGVVVENRLVELLQE